MNKQLLSRLHQSLFGPRKSNERKRTGSYRRKLSMESLESRQLLSITPLQSLDTGGTGEKPQSKVFEYAGEWWTVMPGSSGATVYRLDGTSWTPTQNLASTNGFKADVKVVGDLAHVLLFDGGSTQLATLQYDAADNRFEPWALRPQVVGVPISGSAETATLDVDSTGRMWVAYDVSSTVEVRYSDGLYTSWSAPTTLGSMNSDDISAVIAMPNNTVGVMWSNQSADRFGFRVHVDGAAPTSWSADEVPASQSALSAGGGMADDHIHLAVASDGTLYAAVKTSYDSGGYPKIALLVRRPNGQWDNLYTVSGSGTRPIVVLNEVAGKLIVAYTSSEGGGNILYRESPLGNISFGAQQTLISGSVNNVTSTKHTSTDEIVFLASSKGVLFSFGVPSPVVVNQPPVVDAGPDWLLDEGEAVALNATVSDDGRPVPATLSTTWAKDSGPGTVSFANRNAVDTSATFSAPGDYVLRLTASDGSLSSSDVMSITVSAAPPAPGPAVVVKTIVHDGVVFTLDSDGWLSTNGRRVWTDTYDFAFSPVDGTLYWQSNYGLFQHRLPGGEWQNLDFDAVKFEISQAGAAYTLGADGWLAINGRNVWTNTKDFAFAADQTLYWLSDWGLLQRRRQDGTWENLESAVTRFSVRDDGVLYTLAADHMTRIDGRPVWQDTHDFLFSDDQSLCWLSTYGLLQRQGAGGAWQNLDTNVAEFAVKEDGAVYSLASDGSVSVDGAQTWSNIADLRTDEMGCLILQGANGSIHKISGRFDLSHS